MGRPPDGWLGPLHDMLPGRLAVCRLDPNEPVPAWAATSGPLVSVTRMEEELSVVSAEGAVLHGVTCEKGWRCLRIRDRWPYPRPA